MDGYFTVLTAIDLFVLGFMCVLTALSESLSRKQKRGFLLAFGLIGGISLLEIVTVAVDGASARYRWANVLANYLGFGLSPGVPVCLMYVLDKKAAPKRALRVAAWCQMGYLVLLALSLPFGLVFRVSGENV